MTQPMEELRARLAEIEDLRAAAAVLDWDQNTKMPPRGAPARAEALATLHSIAHARFSAEETGRLLERARESLDGADADCDDARLVVVTERRYEKARRVPTELATELARAASLGQQAWKQARAQDDFALFAPYLERNIELARRYVACFEGFGGFECAYDALLDDYDPGMRTTEVERLFGELRDALVPLIGELAEREVDDAVLHERVAVERQRELVEEVLALQGFDPEGWRLDDAVHPFATGLGAGDVRITTRWEEGYFPMALFGAMHECGHGLYEDGIAPELRRTPLGQVDSLSLHESQSRLWENIVGRGRAFAEVLAPRVARRLLDGRALEPETLFRAVNRVRPSFIRVEADEATYGLHVVLRFELEQELIEGRLPVSELPQAWNERVRSYLGLEVQRDCDGVLQDVHWSAGLLGYFPTYALGNMVAAQLWARARRDLPDVEQQIASGELGGLREWLREHIHRHGSKYETGELLQRVVGGPIRTEPFAQYLSDKLGAAYGVQLPDRR
jgi:carboxypeptidase Taq